MLGDHGHHNAARLTCRYSLFDCKGSSRYGCEEHLRLLVSSIVATVQKFQCYIWQVPAEQSSVRKHVPRVLIPQFLNFLLRLASHLCILFARQATFVSTKKIDAHQSVHNCGKGCHGHRNSIAPYKSWLLICFVKLISMLVCCITATRRIRRRRTNGAIIPAAFPIVSWMPLAVVLFPYRGLSGHVSGARKERMVDGGSYSRATRPEEFRL